VALTIAVSGAHGAGKSTLAEALAKVFNLRYVSAGLIFRQMAQSRGMTLAQFSLVAENDPSIDRKIDELMRQEAERGNVTIDAYIAGWVAGDLADLKIYLHAPLEVRVRRIAEREGRDYQELLEETRIREESQRRRFREFYGIDVEDIRFFDLVINTAKWDADGVIHFCIEAVKAYLNSSSKTHE